MTLIVIGFIAGVISAISPCILPVLPVILTVGSTAQSIDDRRARTTRSIATVFGLVVSFSLFTLVGSEILSALGLPQDLLRDGGLVLLGLLGAGLLYPPLGHALERPFARLPVRRRAGRSSAFLTGLGLGAVYVPCAGPVLATITLVGARHRIGASAVLLTLAFAVGTAVPLLSLAITSTDLVARIQSLRSRAGAIRRVSGAVLVVMAIVIATGALDGLQRTVPGYTNALQQHVESSVAAREQLATVAGEAGSDGSLASCTADNPTLQRCGDAPAFAGIARWLNTPHGGPLTISSLRGHVVLVDFWTYSCINCQRSLPHVEAWYGRYERAGLVVVGVHTPEFAFEHVASNVAAATQTLGVTYPVALDNDYSTWVNYDNNYWPAEYLIDADGVVRYIDFGEGNYSTTETVIRSLLRAADPAVALPRRTDVANRTPVEATTPETYLGYARAAANNPSPITRNRLRPYTLPKTFSLNELDYGGLWTVHSEESTAGKGALIGLHFEAKDVYLVLGGIGHVTVSSTGSPDRTIGVAGVPRLYTLVHTDAVHNQVIRLSFSPGLMAYDFTFG